MMDASNILASPARENRELPSLLSPEGKP